MGFVEGGGVKSSYERMGLVGIHGVSQNGEYMVNIYAEYIPDAPCMAYLPTFGRFLG